MAPYSKIKREDLIYPELSFRIVGLAFEVFNELGAGHREKVYQKAMAKQFSDNNVSFKEQLYHPLIFKKEAIEKNYFDFLVEDKVVVELKRTDFFSGSHFEQVNNYLKVSGIQLGILLNFTTSGVRFKRVVNLHSANNS